MKRLRSGTPLWLDRTDRSSIRHYPTAPSVDVDVVIVGGGITGACNAWMLAEAGLRVALVEATHLGRGSTAASSSLLMQEPDEDFADLRARYGGRVARRIWRRSRLVTARMIATIERLRIACDLTRCDSVYVSFDEVSALRQELVLRRRSGAKVRWLDPAALAGIAGISAKGALRTSGNAQADPYKVCLGFLHAAERAGAGIFERSPVRRIETAADGVIVHTPQARLTADHVVIATGYATPDFKPLLRRFRMSHTYVAVTTRLDREARRQLGLENVMLWDTGRPYHYARWTGDGRLLLGGADRPFAGSPARARRLSQGVADLRRHFSMLYPSLHAIAFEYAWEGVFAGTADGLPFIGPHRRYPRHLFALGYGGNGMTFGFLAAELLKRRLLGDVDPDEELFRFGRL